MKVDFRLHAVFAMALLLVLTSFGCKLKPKDGETQAEFKTRQKAVFVAQSTLGLDKWSDAVEILGNGGALDNDARKVQYQVNDQIASGLDIARERLKNPATGNALDKVKSLVTDLREAQRREVVRITNPETKQQVEAIFEISLFALESLQAVLEESRQPTRAELEAKAEALQRKTRAAIPPYLLPMISLAREAGFEALRISRLTTADAWAKAESLSMALHSKNQARLASPGAQVF